jgi:hypothetical protein
MTVRKGKEEWKASTFTREEDLWGELRKEKKHVLGVGRAPHRQQRGRIRRKLIGEEKKCAEREKHDVVK